jgi:hypothetical protein
VKTLSLTFLVALGCGSSGGAPPDAGNDVVYGIKGFDASNGVDVEEAATDAKMPWNRMTPHEGIVLPAAHLWAIYIGTTDVDFDAYMQWLVTSTDYWGAILAQYGVGYGTFDGSTQIDSAAFFTPGTLTGNVIDSGVLQQRIHDVIHAVSADAGASDADLEAGDDGGSTTLTIPPIPGADGYVFFLPDNITVNLGAEGVTCVGIGGYHSYDGTEPYAIIPDCGRSRLVVSHEIAEMCTDPVPGAGWVSDMDALGEVGDLCNFVVQVDGTQATGLWSNKDGDCEPSP